MEGWKKRFVKGKNEKKRGKIDFLKKKEKNVKRKKRKEVCERRRRRKNEKKVWEMKKRKRIGSDDGGIEEVLMQVIRMMLDYKKNLLNLSLCRCGSMPLLYFVLLL